MQTFSLAWRVSLTLLMAGSLAGCTFYDPPDSYSTVELKRYKQKNTDVNYTMVAGDDDYVKLGFIKVLLAKCSNPKSQQAAKNSPPGYNQGDANDECGSGKSTSYGCWVAHNERSKICTDAIITHAVNQCVAKSGTQNTFVAKGELYLGSFLSAAAVAADIAAVSVATSKNNLSSAAVAAEAAAISSGAGNAQKIAPGFVVVKVQDLVQTGQSYVQVAGFSEEDMNHLPPDSPAPDSRDPAFKAVALKYSRLHDAVYATCPVGAF